MPARHGAGTRGLKDAHNFHNRRSQSLLRRGSLHLPVRVAHRQVDMDMGSQFVDDVEFPGGVAYE